MLADDFRDSYKQTKYRNQSLSQNKDTQDVAHKLGLEPFVEALKHVPGSIS